MEEKNIMRHSKEEVEEAFNILIVESSSEKYQNNLAVIIEYVEDLVLMIEKYKKSAEDSAELVSEIIQKIVKLNMEDNQATNSKQRKVTQLKKTKMINDIAQKIDIIKKEEE